MSVFMPGRASKLAIAIHEAGHAVASLTVSPATVVAEAWLARDRSSGGWKGMVERHATGQEGAYTETLVLLAGPVAEIRWRARSRESSWSRGATNADICLGMEHDLSTDFGQVRAYLERYVVGDRRQAFIDAWRETGDLMATHWSAVLRIGRTLRERDRLDGRLVSELFGG